MDDINADKAVKIAVLTTILIAAIVIAFVLHPATAIDIAEPRGPMTGEPPIIHPVESGVMEIPMDEMIYTPVHPEQERPPGCRVLIGMPIRVVDAGGTVYWHWFYQQKYTATYKYQ